MKRLHILRHAKSSWAEPGLQDFDRVLNKRGQWQLQALSKWFETAPFKPQHVLCSAARRTLDTFEGIAAALDHPKLQTERLLYNGGTDDYLDILSAIDDSVQSLMLIGHNPTCDDLARYLTKPSSPAAQKLMERHFGTATMAIFDFDGSGWDNLAAASCSLVQLLRPKELDTAGL